MSNTISPQNLGQAFQVAVARKQLDSISMEGEAAVKLIESSGQMATPKSNYTPPPGLGSMIDVHM
ncbi:MAG: putative motility protein [Deltaproteobacteria bacterium]|nr:putative motility protein [Deltaproteobacteria bacterium]